MATVITSIGSKSVYTDPVNAQFSFSGTSGSGDPWTGTLSHSGVSVTANVGDMLYFRQVYFDCMGGMGGGCGGGPTNVVYLITGVNSGTSTLTLKYISGLASAAMGQDPANLSSNSGSLVQAQPYVLRFYSTISAWNGELDEGELYSNGDTAKGECYKDTDFSITGALTIDGGGTVGLDTRTLTAAVGHRHTGVANTGVRLLRAADGETNWFTMDSATGANGGPGNQIEWLEFDGNEKGVRTMVSVGTYGGIQRCIVHSGRWDHANHNVTGMACGKKAWLCNNIIYDIYCDRGSSADGPAARAWGIHAKGGGALDWSAVCMNTVYNVRTNSTNTTLDCVGMYVQEGYSLHRTYNNICMGTSSDNSTAIDFSTTTNTTYADSNYSSDATAQGNNYQRNQSASDTFASIAGGSIDLHLKSGSNALAAGKDAGANESIGGQTIPYSPYYWDVDIDGRDRDSEGDDWDIGAHQCEDCGGATGNPAFGMFVDIQDLGFYVYIVPEGKINGICRTSTR